jgi:hypothetical protein
MFPLRFTRGVVAWNANLHVAAAPDAADSQAQQLKGEPKAENGSAGRCDNLKR